MAELTLQISHDEVSPDEDRFGRFRLINWWDQNRLSSARILVIGAGALGNEIVKNLALLGIGNVLIADLDRIENSNLSRSVLFRAADNGQFKATVAARAARDIYPQMRTHSFVGNVVYDLGLGAFRWADLIIAGLDNREARLAINRACWKVGKPWIDGAIESISGTARVFSPESATGPDSNPCYECTMSETDWKLLQQRRSCNLLSREQMQLGKTPTTPTIASIIAGMQCQEAVKILHGMQNLSGQGWMLSGESADAYLVQYQRKADCLSHDPVQQIVSLAGGASDWTAAALLDVARQHCGPEASLELCRDVLQSMDCPNCGENEPIFISLGKAGSNLVDCPECGTGRRHPRTFHRISGDETFLDRKLAQLGIPLFDILIARGQGVAVGLELSADAPHVLGPLVGSSEDLQWL